LYTISPLAQRFAPWSISKAGVAETCPAQFNHKYRLKTVETEQHSSNKVGTVSHEILEHRLGGTDAKVARDRALEKNPLMDSELEDLRALGDAIEAFLKRFDGFCKKNGVTEVLREVEWGITAEGKPTGFFAKDVYFRGKVDLGAITASRELVVVDHKSGVATDITRKDKFKTQLNSYAVLAALNVEGLTGVRGGINFLQGPEDKRIQWLDFLDTDRIKRLYVPWLFGVLNTAAENLVEPFPARPSPKWPCAWCGYRTTCSPYQEMLRGAQI